MDLYIIHIHTGLQNKKVAAAQPHGLPLEFQTVGDKLKESGYATHLVGKWHLGSHMNDYTPTYRGFNSFYGFYQGRGDHNDHTMCHGDVCGVDLHDHQGSDHKVVWNNTDYSTHLYTAKAQHIIENHDQAQPLFLSLNYQSPHSPLQVPSDYEEEYQNITSPNRRSYAGMVTCMDEGIGNLTKTLKEKGLWQNTVLVFSTDNGGALELGASNGLLRQGKGTYWEGGLQGVGFVSGGYLPKTGYRNKKLMHVSDWFPTFVHLAQGSTDGLDLDGHNIWNTIIYDTPSPRNEILHNIDPLAETQGENLYPDIFDVRVLAAIRRGQWKLLTGKQSGGGSKNVQLYNMVDDPYEKIEISDSHPEVVLSLLERLAFHNSTAVPALSPPIDQEGIDQVKKTGAWLPWK